MIKNKVKIKRIKKRKINNRSRIRKRKRIKIKTIRKVKKEKLTRSNKTRKPWRRASQSEVLINSYKQLTISTSKLQRLN